MFWNLRIENRKRNIKNPSCRAFFLQVKAPDAMYRYFQSGIDQSMINRRPCLSPCSSMSGASICSDNTSSSTASASTANKHVSFAHLNIREYELGLGDHPCVSSGPPVSIGWTYITETESCISVDEYEHSRPPRRSASQMVMPRDLREAILNDIFEYTRRDIVEAAKEARKVKSQRLKTVRKLSIAPFEEALQGAVHRVKSVVRWTNDSKEQKRLWRTAEARNGLKREDPDGVMVESSADT